MRSAPMLMAAQMLAGPSMGPPDSPAWAPVEGGAELLLGADAGALDGGDEGLDVGLLPVIDDAEGDVDLGVDNALGGQGADHVVGDELVVVGGLQAGADGLEGVEEAEEVAVGVEGAGVGEGEGGGVVALREGDEGFGFDGAFEVEVELDLGERAEPGGDVEFGERGLAGHVAL